MIKTYDGILNGIRQKRIDLFEEEVMHLCKVDKLELKYLYEKFNGDSDAAAEYYQDAILAFTTK